MSNIVVSVRILRQTGPDDFQMEAYSQVFPSAVRIEELFDWAKHQGIKEPCINDLDFSCLTHNSDLH